MITMENTRELIDFEYYGKSYRMAPEEIEAAYRYQEMQYRKADALRMLTSYAFGMENERDRPHGYTTSRNRCLRWSGAASTTSASRCWCRSRRRTPATASERLPVIRYIP